MKFKKIMFVGILLLAIFAIGAVSASDVNDTAIASEDTTQMELSKDNEIADDNLKTSEENSIVQTENEETLSTESGPEILGAGEGNYTDLRNDIANGGNLTKSIYRYCEGDGDTIEITTQDIVINGNGAVIDMNGSTDMQAFYVSASGVTIKNLTIKNANYDGGGGAIYFTSSATSGTVSNCNFVDNKATGDYSYGGAVFFNTNGEVTNCNFTGNSATKRGCAVYFSGTGTVSNCNFTGNSATEYGGAVYFLNNGDVKNCNFIKNTATENGGAVRMNSGNVSNCNFTNNSAHYGGAVYFVNNGDVKNCNFINNTASEFGGAIRFSKTGAVTNCNFTDNTATNKGGAIYMGSGSVSNCNFTNNKATGDYANGGAIFFVNTGTVTNCNFINNKASKKYTYGGAVYFSDKGTVTNCNFTDNTAAYGGAINIGSGNVSNCNFVNNTASEWGGAIKFSKTGAVTNCNFTDNTADSGGSIFFEKTGTVTNCNFVDNTADNAGAIRFGGTGTVTNCNFTNNSAEYGGAIEFDGTGTVLNCNFVNNSATGEGIWGGAIRMYSGTVSNCNFTNNSAIGDDSFGGAVYFNSNGEVTNCNFADNTATYGGAVEFDGTGTVSNCNFTGNNATAGSAIYFYSTSATKTVSNSRFLNNRANAEALEITKNDNNITITFTGRNDLLNAIYSSNDAEVTFTNVTYWGANGITTVSATISGSNKAAGQNITVGVVVNGEIVLNEVKVTDENGTIVLPIIAGENYYISARHDTDSYYTEAEKTINVKVIKYDSKVTISPINATVYSNNVTIKYAIENRTNVVVSIDGVSNDKIIITDDTITVLGLDAGVYTLTVINSESSMYYKSNDTKTFTVNKQATSITSADVSTTYNINKELVITLKDANGNPLTGASVTVDLNGAKTYTTDKNGQVKVSTKGLAPKAYTAKVTFNGNTNYDKSSKDVKVTVKKATPKLTANKKTFKKALKTKKYTIVLKDNLGKAIKNAKVSIKVGKKTYTAKTNNKGKATFKIKKFTKKGTYKATVTYKGNAYYNKVTKKVNIKLK